MQLFPGLCYRLRFTLVAVAANDLVRLCSKGLPGLSELRRFVCRHPWTGHIPWLYIGTNDYVVEMRSHDRSIKRGPNAISINKTVWNCYSTERWKVLFSTCHVQYVANDDRKPNYFWVETVQFEDRTFSSFCTKKLLFNCSIDWDRSTPNQPVDRKAKSLQYGFKKILSMVGGTSSYL